MTLFLEVALRAALVAAGTAAVLWALRIRTAAVKHAAWTAVVIAMLVLPIWSAGGPKLPLPVLQQAPAALVPSIAAGAGDIAPADVVPSGEAASSTATAPAPAAARRVSWQGVLLGVYFAGAFVLIVRLFIGTAYANRLRRRAVIEDARVTSAQCTTPITVGWLKPTLILPAGWQRWPAAQLEAVLTHEREHARRHDPLVQWLALFNRAVFWVHPLAWWLERRLATLAEEACDAAVLAAGHSPQDYSEYLLEMARSVTREGRRVQVVGMAMPGSGLPQRMRQIFEGVPMTPVSRTRVVCTVAFCAMSSVIFAAGTLAPRSAFAPKQASTDNAKFEVVSIKPCPVERPLPGVAPARPGGRSGGAAGWHAQTTPGRVYWDCVTLATLIDQAYAGQDKPLLNMSGDSRPPRTDGLGPIRPKRVRGGPSWVETDMFTVEAKAPVDVTNPGLAGSTGRNLAALPPAMSAALRAVLEDRFQLKVRRETEQRDMYALGLGKNGLNQERVKATKPGDCVTVEEYSAADPSERASLRICGRYFVTLTAWEFTGGTMLELARALSSTAERHVMDRTGLDGRFNYVLRFQEDGGGGPGDDRIFRTLEPLGLKIEPTKGPAEYLLITSVQKLKPNTP